MQTDGYRTLSLTTLRVIAGLGFFSHGAQKLFGVFGGIDGNGATAALASMYGAAGVIETVGGLLIALGLFTRLAAFIASGEMAAAYFIAHVANGGLFWWGNRGELAMIYSVVFLAISAFGAGSLSVDAMRAGKATRSAGGR